MRTQLREKPEYFDAESVRALLNTRPDGSAIHPTQPTKTQDRRVVKNQDLLEFLGSIGDSKDDPAMWGWPVDGNGRDEYVTLARNELYDSYARCPYPVGTRLWCRETWGVGCRPCPHEGWVDGIEYRADEAYMDERDLLPLYQPDAPDDFYADNERTGWRSPIHMPKWAARLWLEVVNVRVERVQEISHADAIAEGCYPCSIHEIGTDEADPPRDQYQRRWDSINASKGYPFESNAWVWVRELKRVEAQAC